MNSLNRSIRKRINLDAYKGSIINAIETITGSRYHAFMARARRRALRQSDIDALIMATGASYEELFGVIPPDLPDRTKPLPDDKPQRQRIEPNEHLKDILRETFGYSPPPAAGEEDSPNI